MPQLHCLRDQCLTAFGNYVQEAQKTCMLLGDWEDRSDPLEWLFAVLAQTRIEEQAQAAYLLLRRQLFEVLDEMEDC